MDEKIETGTEVVDNTQDYLAAIKELKLNSVDRKKYDEAIAENKKLIKAIVDGQDTSQETQKVVYSDDEVNALREKLFDTEKHDLSNLDYVQTALELRKAILDKSGGKTDIFVGTNNAFEPTQEDYFRAENTADSLQECVDYANGDSQLFTQELQRRMKR